MKKYLKEYPYYHMSKTIVRHMINQGMTSKNHEDYYHIFDLIIKDKFYLKKNNEYFVGYMDFKYYSREDKFKRTFIVYKQDGNKIYNTKITHISYTNPYKQPDKLFLVWYKYNIEYEYEYPCTIFNYFKKFGYEIVYNPYYDDNLLKLLTENIDLPKEFYSLINYNENFGEDESEYLNYNDYNESSKYMKQLLLQKKYE